MQFLMQYFMPTSMTWWAAFAMVISGLIILAASVFPGLTDVAGMLTTAYHGMSATELVNAGLIGIGLRKAIG